MSPEGSMLDLPLTGCVPLCKPLTLSGPKFYLLYTEVGAQDHSHSYPPSNHSFSHSSIHVFQHIFIMYPLVPGTLLGSGDQKGSTTDGPQPPGGKQTNKQA